MSTSSIPRSPAPPQGPLGQQLDVSTSRLEPHRLALVGLAHQVKRGEGPLEASLAVDRRAETLLAEAREIREACGGETVTGGGDTAP